MTAPAEVRNDLLSSVRVELSGYDLLNNPRLNMGTAFTEEERKVFDLHGLLPPHYGSMEDQLERRRRAFRNQTTNFSKYSFMRDLQDTNETLFYAFIEQNIEELLPVVYTPTAGEGWPAVQRSMAQAARAVHQLPQ